MSEEYRLEEVLFDARDVILEALSDAWNSDLPPGEFQASDLIRELEKSGYVIALVEPQGN